jgi:hypothetical protein
MGSYFLGGALFKTYLAIQIQLIAQMFYFVLSDETLSRLMEFYNPFPEKSSYKNHT